MDNTLSKLPNRLEGVQEIVRTETGEMFYRGKLANLSVLIFPNRIHVKGSIGTYHHGPNLKTLTREETAHGIEHLSDDLHVNMNTASISRLDFGTNLILDRPYWEYMPFLGELPYYSANQFGSGKHKTLSLSNSQREIRFYNKIREMKKKGHRIPGEWLGLNVCRYEVSFKHPAKDFKVSNINAKMLYEKDFFFGVLKKWEEIYFKIKRIPKMKVLSEIQLTSVLDLQKLALTALAMNNDLFQTVMSEIERRPLTRSQRSRLRSKLIDSRTNKNFTLPDKRITELDEKVRETVRFYQS